MFGGVIEREVFAVEFVCKNFNLDIWVFFGINLEYVWWLFFWVGIL